MKRFKFYLIGCSILVTFLGCSTFPEKTRLTNARKKDLLVEYCENGIAKKELSFNVKYYTPEIPKGTPLDHANELNSKNEKERTLMLKTLFFNLSRIETQSDYYAPLDWLSLEADSEADVINNTSNIHKNKEYKISQFIIKLKDKNKFYIYQTNPYPEITKYKYTYYDFDLNNLIENYTMLIPLENLESILNIQNTYSNVADGKFLIYTERAELSPSRAINNRNKLWNAYIKYYTSIKEDTSDDSNIYNAQVTLDLNPFCKYGRKTSDLISE